MLASDMNNREFAGASNPDEVLHVKFYLRSMQNQFESEKQGRAIFYEAPFVQIMTPGNQLNIIDTPVRPEHKNRFPRQWAAFENNNKVEHVIGTPVEEWPAITRSQADELKFLKFFTVEQIANASDQQLQMLGMNANMLKQKAQAFLAKAKDTALVQHQAAELARKDQEMEDMKKQMAALTAKMEELSAPEEKQKRKYTRKAKPDQTEAG